MTAHRRSGPQDPHVATSRRSEDRLLRASRLPAQTSLALARDDDWELAYQEARYVIDGIDRDLLLC